jgi:hypothetical protein
LVWWTGEINVIAFLPIILAIPDKKTIQSHIQQFKQQPFQYEKFLPLLGVILSVILTHFSGSRCNHVPHCSIGLGCTKL